MVHFYMWNLIIDLNVEINSNLVVVLMCFLVLFLQEKTGGGP